MRCTGEAFRRTRSAVYLHPLRSIVLFPSCLDMSALVPESFLKASSRSGSHSSWQTQTRRFLCVTRNPVHFGFFFSLSLSSITVLPGICSTSCYAVVCEEAAFPSLDPGSGQACGSYFRQRPPGPKVVLRAIRLQLSTLSFVLKPFLSICSHFCHEPWGDSLQVFLWKMSNWNEIWTAFMVFICLRCFFVMHAKTDETVRSLDVWEHSQNEL